MSSPGRASSDTMSAAAVTIPSVKRKPAARSASAPGVRIVTAKLSPSSRTSSAASTATASVAGSRRAVVDAHQVTRRIPSRSVTAGRITSARVTMFFGLGQQKPHHYREMVRIAWENRDQLPFAWRILKRRRLRRLRARHLGPLGLDAAGHAPLHGAAGADAAEHRAGARSRACSPTSPRSRGRSSAELRALGRLPEPMLRRRGEPGFRVVTWDEALDRRRRRTARDRSAAPGVLPDLARHHQRGLLRGAEGGALPRHQPRRQLGAPLPRGVDRRR